MPKTIRMANPDRLLSELLFDVPEPDVIQDPNTRYLHESKFDAGDTLYSCHEHTMTVEEYHKDATFKERYTGGDKRFFFDRENAIKDAHNRSVVRAANALKLRITKFKNAVKNGEG